MEFQLIENDFFNDVLIRIKYLKLNYICHKKYNETLNSTREE